MDTKATQVIDQLIGRIQDHLDKKKKVSKCGNSANKCGSNGCSSKGNLSETAEEVKFHEMVSEYYGKTLSTSADLKTNACCTAEAPPLTIREALKRVPSEINSKYYGCGSPLPFGIEGLSVLDLGSGSGRDCYIAAQLVGEEGKVIGIDMTDEQLVVSRKYSDSFCKETLGYKRANLQFIKGYIEMLPQYIEPESIDIIISNCVVNLSPRKDKVLCCMPSYW